MRRSAVANRAFAVLSACAAAVRRLISVRTPANDVTYRAMFEESGVGNARVGLANDRTLAANPALCRLLGYEHDELLERTIVGLAHPDDRAALAALFRQLASGSIPRFACEGRFTRGDGSTVWASVQAAALHDEPGFAVVTMEDVTERRRAETALRTSEERYRLVSRVIADAVYEWNLDTNAVQWSDGLRTLFDYHQEDVDEDASWWSDRIHPDERTQVLTDIHAAIDGDAPGWAAEYRFRRRDGGFANVVDRAFIERDATGKARRLIGAMLDVTEQRTLEAERELLLAREKAARQEAEAANRAKDQFLAMLSHELRAPLSPILGWSGILLEDKLDEPERREALEAIHRNAQQQHQLVGDLLDVSSIVSGKIRLDPVPTDLRTVIERALDAVRFSADAKQVQLESVLEPDVGLVVCDADRMQQVVWNLLSNAVKFTPAGGVVGVHLRGVGNDAVIEVRDDGRGIDPDMLSRVFERFWQAESTAARQQGGLGLGLTIVRHLVELHGGDVEVHSEGRDRGTVFRVRLPRLAAEASGPLKRAGSCG
ncbi:MAG TPA: PAS domain-containing protein [Candidatus Binatia bacterium]